MCKVETFYAICSNFLIDGIVMKMAAQKRCIVQSVLPRLRLMETLDSDTKELTPPEIPVLERKSEREYGGPVLDSSISTCLIVDCVLTDLWVGSK